MFTKERVFLVWTILATILAIGISVYYKASLPIFTLIWLIVPIIVVLKKRDAKVVGFRKVKFKKLIKYTLINLITTLIIILVIELLTNTYKDLVEIAVYETDFDVTFHWLNELNGYYGYIVMFLVSTLITIFGEELFFRGYLIQLFKRKFNVKTAIILQAILFSLPHTILAFYMGWINGLILVLGYGVLIYGIIGGWTAHKTNSIWPGLITANINNLILVMIYL